MQRQRAASIPLVGWWMVWLALALVAILSASAAAAQEVLPVPLLSGRVIDQTGTLDASQQAALDAKLQALETSKGSQVVVLVVPSTQPEDIASYANRVANSWKIGRRDVGDGVLLVVARNDRKLRIEVAKTLEGALPDLAAKRIIDNTITPRFREGDYAGGLNAGVDQIIARVSGEALPEPAQPAPASQRGVGGFEWMDMLVFMVFALPIGAAVARSIFGRKLGALFTGAGVGGLAAVLDAGVVIAAIAGLAALVFALVTGFSSPVRGRRGWSSTVGGFGSGVGMGSGGGWGSRSGGGGGFSSGGGGDFGGGGASGNW